MIESLNETGRYLYYLYEADERNTPSIRLAKKFQHQKDSYEEITTDSGKKLMLQTYRIYG